MAQYQTEDLQLQAIAQGLSQIEAIVKAESKRRIESNQVTQDYIHSYLDKLEQSIQQRVHAQFEQIEKRIQEVNSVLTRVEERFDEQELQVATLIDTKMQEADAKIRDADVLLRNVRGSFKSQNEKV